MDFVDKRSHECINCAIDSANENMNISDDKIKNLTLMIEILQRENLNLKVKLNLTNNDKPEWKI
ncbi:MAG: hypothetical protein COA52_00640 [Hyphomicrobiales bacterium]|nr:MAG: hypothetical protein COA52_00640 [Hyphomicrobiales bacterium]